MLPKNGIIKGMLCKFWHANQNIICKRCGSDDHRTVDTDKCKSYVSEPSSSVFISDTDPRSIFFVVENKLTVFDREWITSEHPYQWKKMIDNGLMGLADKVAVAPTPRKAIANTVPYINLNNWDEEHRLSVMRTILMAKRKYSDEFRQSLLKSNGKMNIEGTIDHFWGSGVPYKIASQTDPNQLIGRNEGCLLTNASSNDPQSTISVISPSTNPSLQVNNDVMGNNDTSALLTQISSPVPSISASTPLYVNIIHKSDSELKDTEHDYELLPKLLMPVERCSKDPRRARSIRKYNSNIRSSSAYKADRRDMRPIDDFFAPGKRKDGAASPESDIISKISKSDSHVLSCPVLSDCAIGDGESGSGVVVF